ncbi:hypothetical protein MCANUFG4_02645 [Mycoplasmopsis canis UFG4]|uniref:Lipoprotein n=1 Tax=Mycoplasmopsis canis UFG4 TaxID=1131455 RepID=I1A4D5_9BACT|nr:hypothetical protein [Mycoplasmopsis canis]EIE41356.1 hypothetical protein MCANUFG4_02645 [Mycoplasmopsis canis UFG4]
MKIKKLVFLTIPSITSLPLVISCNNVDEKEYNKVTFEYLLQKNNEENGVVQNSTFILDLTTTKNEKFLENENIVLNDEKDFEKNIVENFLSKSKLKSIPKKDIYEEFERRFLSSKKISDVLKENNIYVYEESGKNNYHFIQTKNKKLYWKVNVDDIYGYQNLINKEDFSKYFIVFIRPKNYIVKSPSKLINGVQEAKEIYDELKSNFKKDISILDNDTKFVPPIYQINRNSTYLHEKSEFTWNILEDNYRTITNTDEYNSIFKNWFSKIKEKDASLDEKTEILKAKDDFRNKFLNNISVEEILNYHNIFIYEGSKHKYNGDFKNYLYEGLENNEIISMEQTSQTRLDSIVIYNNENNQISITKNEGLPTINIITSSSDNDYFKNQKWFEVVLVPKTKKILFNPDLLKSEKIWNLAILQRKKS